MESSERGALSLVRLVAACIILVGALDAIVCLMEFVVPLLQSQHHGQSGPAAPLNILRLTLDMIPVIIGIVIFFKARAIAEWLSDLIEN